jgi:alpha-mannosidase
LADQKEITIDRWRIDGRTIEVGEEWVPESDVVQFAASVSVPTSWPLSETFLALDLGGESLLSLDYGDGRVRRFGLDPNHQEFPVEGRHLFISSESVARLPFGEPAIAPQIGRAAVLLLDIPVHSFQLLLRQIGETVDCLEDHEVVPHLLTAAEIALRLLEWPSYTENYVTRIQLSPRGNLRKFQGI